ncbi:MAG: hypothetical protein ACD_21C00190G0004 [uncultured bacterium]|nr:MAG: hypothetical protein ACD_21C00190G0004 [uncultured bacterium]
MCRILVVDISLFPPGRLYMITKKQKVEVVEHSRNSFYEISVNESSFPWIIGRQLPNAKPRHKIVSRSISKSLNSIVMLHTAGTGYVKNYYMEDLLNNKQMLDDMDPSEVELLRWVINSEKEDPLDDIRKNRQSLEFS